MAIAQTNIQYDTMEVRIISPDQGLFILAMLKPGTSQWVKTGQITAGGDADQFAEGIKGFYKTLYGVDPLVTLKYVDQDDLEVEADAFNMRAVVYTVQTPTALNGPSVETIMVLPLSTFSTIEFVYPTEIQLSSPPLTGKFWIECHNTEG